MRRDGAGGRGDGVAAGSNTSLPVSGGVGAGIAGSFGVLTLNADGSYSYDGNPNVVPPAGATDMFVYTITDGDGDTSTVTLTITVTGGNSAPPGLDLDANNSAAGGSDYTSTFTIGGSAIPIADIDVNITDPDSTTMASANIIMIANGQVPPPNDTLSIQRQPAGGITASAYDPTTERAHAHRRLLRSRRIRRHCIKLSSAPRTPPLRTASSA